MQKFIILLKADFAFVALLVGAAISFLIGTPGAILVGHSYMFTAFDCEGYFKTLQRRETDDKTDDPEIIASYRLIQAAFQFMLLRDAFLSAGWPVVIALLVWHFSGINDLLYYRFLKQKTPKEFTWLYWTPVGFVFEKLLKRPTPLFAATLQAIIGLSLSLSIIHFLRF